MEEESNPKVKELDPMVKEILEKVGNQVKHLRKTKVKQHYKDFANNKLPMGQNTYLRIEKGNGDYHISNLIQVVLNYPDLKLSKFFKDAGL